VLAMKEIWTKDEAEFHGEFVNFDPIYLWPKPVQRPHPPILVGGASPRVLERVVAYGDGWIPSTSGGVEQLISRIPELNRLAEAAGRGPLPVTVTSTPPDAGVIDRFRAAGVVRCVFFLPHAGRDEVLPLLDQLAKLIGEFR
jgi:alkanesulfonate monooxygenase SsuD/methylene tetrahydromethanopterin reductase-like flavin-dependent oxidoreductase (luciferase family)